MYRKSRPEDCEAVYDLICDMESRSLPRVRFSEIYRRQARDGRYYCLVDERAGTVVAVLNLRFEEQLHHAERIAEILECAVREEYRNQGIGRELFAEGCRVAGSRGCVQIEVACNQLRHDTHRFYLNQGMHNFHFKFSKGLAGSDSQENAIGK